MDEDDDPYNKAIPQQISQTPQSSPIIHTLLFETQNQYTKDSHLSQDMLTNLTSSSSRNFNDSPHIIVSTDTNALTQTPIKPTSTQSLPVFDPSFFAQCKACENFLLNPTHF